MASVYETYTYEEIKNLPDDQKVLALKELKNLYPDNKDLAKHLDVIPMVVSNMVGKYLEGKQSGRKPMTEEEKAQAKIEREAKKLKELQEQQQLQKQQEEEKEKEKVNKTESQESQESKEVENKALETATIPIPNIQTQINSSSFTIKLDKNIAGEEATMMLSSLANTLLKDGKYKISLTIEEVEREV